MKPKSALRSFLLLAGSSLLAISSASAATYYWDNNSTTAGFGTASGTWGSDAFWTTDGTGAFGVAGIVGPLTTDTTNFGNAGNGLATGTITVTGTVNSGDMTFATGSGDITLSGGNINFGTSTTIRAGIPTFTATIASNITAATTTLTKAGSGTLVLSGANSYAAGTRISGGGTLVLDYGSGNDNSKLADGAALTTINLGGNLTLKGGSHTEVVTGFTIGGTTTGFHGGHTHISRDGGTSTLNLGVITRQQSRGATVSFAEGSLATTTSTVFRGMLGGGITVGSNWAKVDGSGNIIALTSSDYTTLSAPVIAAAVNYQLTGGLSIAGAVNVNSLRIERTGTGNQTLDLGTGNLTVSVVGGTGNTFGNSGGILYAGGGTDNYTITSSGTLGAQNGNQEMIIHTHAGTLTLDMAIATGSAASGLTKSGAGTLILTKAGTYSGGTSVNQGVLQLKHADAAGTSLNTDANAIRVGNNAALELANGVAIGNKKLTLTGYGVSDGGALRNVASNTSSYAGAISISSGGARINSDAGGALTLSGGITTFNVSDITFGGAGNTTVETTAISGGGTLTKDGAGTLTLSATNTYTGATTVGGGAGSKLIVNGNISTSVLTTVASGATLGGTGTVGAATISGILAPGDSSISTLTSTGDVTWNANNAWAYELGLSAADLTLANTTGTRDLLNITGVNSDFLKGTGTGFAFDFANTGTAGFYKLVDWDGTSTFAGSDFTATNLASGLTGTFVVDSGTSALYLNVAIPEPSTALLGALGMLALLRRRR